jgi:hypothetical protein
VTVQGAAVMLKTFGGRGAEGQIAGAIAIPGAAELDLRFFQTTIATKGMLIPITEAKEVNGQWLDVNGSLRLSS